MRFPSSSLRYCLRDQLGRCKTKSDTQANLKRLQQQKKSLFVPRGHEKRLSLNHSQYSSPLQESRGEIELPSPVLHIHLRK
jgi:hypothetical protein